MAKKSTPVPSSVPAHVPVNSSPNSGKPATRVTPQVPAIPGTTPLGVKPSQATAPAPVAVVDPAPAPVVPPIDPAPTTAVVEAGTVVDAPKKPGRKAPPKVAPAPFIPALIKAAIDHAANTRMADLLFYFGLDADGLEIQPVVMTTELAKTCLTGNINNRSLSKPNVKKLLGRMVNGKWAWDMPLLVIIDTDGKMHNGQHTLNALIEAEKTRTQSQEWLDHFASLGMDKPLCFQNCVVLSGLRPEIADHIDTGMVRKHSDIVFRKHLLENMNRSDADLRSLSNIIATTCKFVWLRLVYGQKQRAPRQFGHEDMVEFLEQYPGIVRSAEFVFDEDKASGKEDGKTKLSKRLTLPQAATLHFLMANVAYFPGKTDLDQADDEAVSSADQFIKGIAFGGVKGGTDAISVVCDWIASMGKSSLSNAALEARFDGYLVAADAYLKGETVTKDQLIVPEEVQELTPENLPMWITGNGTRGYTDDQGSFHWFDDQKTEQVWTKADLKKGKVTLLPINVPSYPALGGLDTHPDDVIWPEEVGEAETEADEVDPSEVEQPAQ